jgi:hypothetical protein
MAVKGFDEKIIATNAMLITWKDLEGGDTGEPRDLSDYNDNTVQVTGATFDGAVTIEGSNDGLVWNTLTLQGLGLPASFTATGSGNLIEAHKMIRPAVAAGTSDNTVSILIRRSV